MKSVTMAVCLSALSAGCGGSTESSSMGTPPSGNVAQGGVDREGVTDGFVPGDARLHGQLTIREFADDNDRIASVAAARFVALEPDSARYDDALLRSIDTCIVVPQRTDDLLRVPDSAILSNVSVGENIVLTSPAGTWATLQRTDTASVYVDSVAQGRIEGRVPSGLMVDLPADGAFPAFTAVALPDPQPTGNAFVPAIGSRVDATTEYRWAANDASGSRVHLVIEAIDTRVDCLADDDGLFTVPEHVAASVGTAATLAAVARESTRVEHRDGATLVMTVSTGSP